MPIPDHQNWLHSLRRGISDLWFLLSLTVAVLLLITLFNYTPSDPGWSSSGQGEARHLFGTVGAYSADALLSFFGYTAYLLPIGLLVMGWQSVRRAQLDAELMAWKTFSLVIALVALAGILALHWPIHINSLALTGGGMLGQKLSIELLRFWSLPVVMLIYTVFFLLGITTLFEIPWLRWFEKIGRVVVGFWMAAMAVFRSRGAQQAAVDEPHTLREQLGGDAVEEPVLPFDWQSYQPREHDDADEALPAILADEDAAVAPLNHGTMDDALDEEESWFLEEQEKQREQARIHAVNQSVKPVFSFTEEGQIGVAATEGIVANKPAATWPEPAASAKAEPPPEQPLPSPENERPKVNIAARPTPRPPQPPTAAKHTNPDSYTLPSLGLLSPAPARRQNYTEVEIEAMKSNVETALRNYRLDVTVVNVEVGPVVTRLELDLAPGIKVSQVSNLDKDIARSLAVPSVRVVEVIPGKPYIGLEIPNRKREIVHLRSVLESPAYQAQDSALTLVLGGDIAGQPVVANLGKMPHLLVAGTTGSGKSVGINVMLASMLYKARPDELKLILVDPKTLEMAMYEDIPHLLTPVVTDMNDAENALRWAVAEMERRYQLMAAMKVRSIDGFNRHIQEKRAAGERIDDPLWRAEDHLGIAHQPPELDPLPYIVIVIDELADMMMAVGKKVEELIARIAQKARAAGIHLILATQRPSVDVITGLIKANVPTRIAFQVSSKIDSRTIIDQQGAEALLGYGDMLFVPPGSAAPQRVHGAYIDDKEVDRLTSYLKTQGLPQYEQAITSPVAPEEMGAFGATEKSDDPEQDPLYDEAVAMVIEHGKASISWLQRRLSIGYNRSARLIEAMEQAGIVSPPDRGSRKVLIEKSGDEDFY